MSLVSHLWSLVDSQKRWRRIRLTAIASRPSMSGKWRWNYSSCSIYYVYFRGLLQLLITKRYTKNYRYEKRTRKPVERDMMALLLLQKLANFSNSHFMNIRWNQGKTTQPQWVSVTHNHERTVCFLGSWAFLIFKGPWLLWFKDCHEKGPWGQGTRADKPVRHCPRLSQLVLLCGIYEQGYAAQTGYHGY